MRLFLENGVRTVTINKIVQELHTSKRTLYHHFPDKTELLRACLAVYHEQVKKENIEIIQRSKNAIEAMGILHQEIVKRASMVNPNFFNDILHYHPGLLQESYRGTDNFAHSQLQDMAEWAIADGIFMDDIDVDVAVKTVLGLLRMLKDNNLFPVREYSKERLTFGALVPYMRGLCTSKGLRILKKQETLFQVAL